MGHTCWVNGHPFVAFKQQYGDAGPSLHYGKVVDAAYMHDPSIKNDAEVTYRTNDLVGELTPKSRMFFTTDNIVFIVQNKEAVDGNHHQTHSHQGT